MEGSKEGKEGDGDKGRRLDEREKVGDRKAPTLSEQVEGLWGAGAGTGGPVEELSGSPFFDFPPLPPLPVFLPLPPLKPFC